MHEASKIEVIKDTYIFAVDYTSSPNRPLELENREHENLEDQHPSARSLKFRYKNLVDRHPSARSLKKYVKEIKGEVQI